MLFPKNNRQHIIANSTKHIKLSDIEGKFETHCMCVDVLFLSRFSREDCGNTRRCNVLSKSCLVFLSFHDHINHFDVNVYDLDRRNEILENYLNSFFKFIDLFLEQEL